MIKYLGSKRRLVPVLAQLCAAADARQALDLFTGTTRVAQAFKQCGATVTAVDTARYAEVFARCYVETDATTVDKDALRDALEALQAVPPEPGYFTDTFCVQSRFFQPENGAKVDAIRTAIARDHAGSPLEPLLLTSLIEAADRVDSTTGVQMAYVKQWAPRSFRPLELREPELVSGPGRAVRGDACALAPELTPDVATSSISPTSTRRTTSIATSPTTTCGRRWWPGTRRSITAWRASVLTHENPRRRACSTRSA